MKAKSLLPIFLLCFFLIAQTASQAQTCPPNIDFEEGTFNHWEGRTGSVYLAGGLNTISWTSPDFDFENHVIIGPDNNQFDFFGEFPQRCPNGSGYSVRLGDGSTGARVAGLTYIVNIPANSTKFSLVIQYAIVLQNPGHSSEEQPRFRMNVTDDATGVPINCVNFDFTASGSLPGFKTSPRGDAVVYKDWTPINLDLNSLAGHTIRVEFIASDCTLGGHFGYAYVDVNSSCDGTVAQSIYCTGDNTVTLRAPYGFANYAWYADQSFGSIIGTAQNVLLDPLPPIGQVFPVIVTPYPGYGCVDTLYATTTQAQKPISNAGPATSTCNSNTVDIGGIATPGLLYSWTPANLLNNPQISNPTVNTGLLAATDFYLTTTDVNTGCMSMDTVTVTPTILDTSLTVLGPVAYCMGKTLTTTLKVNNPSATVKWFLQGSATAGINGNTFTPTTVGNYYATIDANGCMDKTRVVPIVQVPQPSADFAAAVKTQCVNNPILFTNGSGISDGTQLTYLWRFENNLNAQSKDVVKTFTTAGDHSVELVAISSAGCRDSITKSVTMVANCALNMPSAFTPNGDTRNDIVKPQLIGDKKLKRFNVYDRFGNVIFTTTIEGKGWDGTSNGKKMTMGSYVWMVEYYDSYHHTLVEKGTITLIR